MNEVTRKPARTAREEIPGFAWLTAKNNPNIFYALTREKHTKKTQSTKTPPKNTKQKHQNVFSRFARKIKAKKAFALTREKNDHVPGVAQMSQKTQELLLCTPWPNWQAPVSTRKPADHDGARGGGFLERIARCPHARTPTPAGALRHARTHAHTRPHGRPTTNDATCGPPAWLTGPLHEEGIRSVRSPLRRAPLLGPYRHALARRPPRKARPFVS